MRMMILIGIITQMRRKIGHELQRMKKVKACHDFESFCKRLRQSDDQSQGLLLRKHRNIAKPSTSDVFIALITIIVMAQKRQGLLVVTLCLEMQKRH